MTDRMRSEFERTNSRDHRRVPPKGNNYIDPMAQLDWESFQKGWKQCLEAVQVDLPSGFDLHDWAPGSEEVVYLRDVKAALEKVGITPC